jgi:hypothetical protein
MKPINRPVLERIFRYVGPGVLPADTIASLDKPTNVLTIDRELYDQLSEGGKREILRMEAACEVDLDDAA